MAGIYPTALVNNHSFRCYGSEILATHINSTTAVFFVTHFFCRKLRRSCAPRFLRKSALLTNCSKDTTFHILSYLDCPQNLWNIIHLYLFPWPWPLKDMITLKTGYIVMRALERLHRLSEVGKYIWYAFFAATKLLSLLKEILGTSELSQGTWKLRLSVMSTELMKKRSKWKQVIVYRLLCHLILSL